MELINNYQVPEGYKKTEVGVIPEDWEVKKIGDFTDCTAGGTPSTLIPLYWNGSIRWMSSGELHQKVIYDVDARITEEGLKFSSTKLIPPNCVLIGLAGQGRTRGTVAINAIELCTNQSIAAIYPSNSFDYRYLFYNLENRYEELRGLSTGDGGRGGLNLTIIRNIFLPFPPLPEQKAIAQTLSDVDALIAALDKLIAKKRHIKTGTMQQLLTGKTRLPGFTREWEVKKLGDVVEKIVGGGTPSRSNPGFWNGNIPWVTVKDFATFNPRSTQEYITKEGLAKSASNLIPKGRLIISTRMALGKAVFYSIDVAINQDLKAIFLHKDIDSMFLYYFFQRNAEYIENLGSGSTVKGIVLTDLQRIPFVKPLLEEQKAIAQVLSDIDSEITALEKRHAKTQAIKQGMMQELLTGRTRLKFEHPDDPITKNSNG